MERLYNEQSVGELRKAIDEAYKKASTTQREYVLYTYSKELAEKFNGACKIEAAKLCDETKTIILQ